MFCSFQGIDIWPLWLSLYLDIFLCDFKWEYFLAFFPDNPLLVYRNAIDFCILILYYKALLNSFTSSNSILVETLGFIYGIMSSVNSDSFTSSLPMWMTFISLSYLIVVSRTSNIIPYGSGKSGHLCLGPDFRGKVFSFSPLYMMLAMHLS